MGSDVNRQYTSVCSELFKKIIFPNIQILLMNDLEAELLHQRAYDSSHFHHGDILPGTHHRSLRERHEYFAISNDLLWLDDLA